MIRDITPPLPEARPKLPVLTLEQCDEALAKAKKARNANAIIRALEAKARAAFLLTPRPLR